MTARPQPPPAGPASYDARLERVQALVERGSIDVLSLDVFDTLLWRLVPEPVDAFPLLGRRLRELGNLRKNTSSELFGRLREAAEAKARQRSMDKGDGPEVFLAEIYAELPDHLFDSTDADELADLEVEFDRSITFADLDIVGMAQWAQESYGVRLVCVSDIYYTESQLRRILDQVPVDALKLEQVFTSSQRGTGKASDLFAVVLAELGVDAARVVHVGDNRQSDVEAPGRAGIAAVHFDKFPGRLATILEKEELLRGRRKSRSKPTLDPVEGDFGLTAIRAKVLGRQEQYGLSHSVNPYWRFGASVLGPAFTSFAEWVQVRAAEHGLDKVSCAMREGEFLSRLINGATYMNPRAHAQPFWLSRQVCSIAAIGEASRDELSQFVNRRAAPTVEQLCTTLGVSIADLPALQTLTGQRLDDPDVAGQVLDTLSSSVAARAAIVSHAAQLRNRLVDYLSRTVDLAGGRLLVVDLGWAGTIQAKLEAALAAAGVDLKTIGLYFLTHEGALQNVLNGVNAEGFLASGGLPTFGSHWVTRSPEILEQVCMCDMGSLVDISEDGEPVLGEALQLPSQVLQRSAVQRGVLSFQREWGRYRPTASVGHRPMDEAARPLLMKSVTRFIVAPTEEEASIFAPWHHDENFGSEASETMAPDDLAPTLRYMTPAEFLRLPMTRVYWPFGLARLFNPDLALTAGAMAEGILPEGTVTSSEPCRVRVLIDVGGGFSEAATRDAGPNLNGLCFVREEIWAKPLRNVMVRIGDGPGVVRMDWLMLTVSVKDRPDPIQIRIDNPSAFDGVKHRNAVALTQNVLLAPKTAPEVIYPCPAEWSSDAYKVVVEMGLAWMPLPPLRGRAPGQVEKALHVARRVGGKARSVWLSSSQEADGRYQPPI